MGDRVIMTTSGGLWAEYAAVSANSCFVMPDDMTYEEGAAIPVNYVTALVHYIKAKCSGRHMIHVLCVIKNEVLWLK